MNFPGAAGTPRDPPLTCIKVRRQRLPLCSVRRFWGGDEEERGQLIHTAGRRWAFSSVPGDDADDEPNFRLEKHAFRPGE